MKLKIKYFGMLSEIAENDSEFLELNPISVSELKKVLQERYPKFITMNFKIAVNHSLVDESASLKNNDEIALLPPFAGG